MSRSRGTALSIRSRNCPVGWMQIQPHDIPHLLDEQGIGREERP
jgi:hypothetical protein